MKIVVVRNNYNPYNERTLRKEIAMRKKRYGVLAFLFDIIMICLTGGLWLIWIFAREMRNR
jgi:hypothetical protein